MYEMAELEQIDGSLPLSELDNEDLALIHRHWMWGNQQRAEFDRRIAEGTQAPETGEPLAGELAGFMLAWYGLLWSVVECLTVDRSIEFLDPLAADIESMSDLLRRCRNSVMHVPKDGSYYDDRITAMLEHEGAPEKIRLIHASLGQLLVREMRRRRAD